MLREPNGSKAVHTTGQQRDNYMQKGDPVGEVHPRRKRQRTTVGCCSRTYNHRGHRRSPVAVHAVQLLLDLTADAAAIVPVQPPPQHTHANLTFAFSTYEELHF